MERESMIVPIFKEGQKAPTIERQPTKLVTYDRTFDQRDYRNLDLLLSTNREEYVKQKGLLDSYTRKNLETTIGERVNAGISKYIYEHKNGMLFREGSDEPILDIIKRGVEWRRNNGSTVVDREEAELTGMQKIQDAMTMADIDEGEMMLSISPPGDDIYTKNFIDVFQKVRKELADGSVVYYTQARRFTADLTNDQYRERLQELGVDVPEDPNDVYFLSNPVLINPKHSSLQDPDMVHAFLHKEHEFMNTEEFEEIILACTPFIIAYINTMTFEPYNDRQQALVFNAILNKADQIADKITARKRGITNISSFNDTYVPDTLSLERQIALLGRQNVRELDTGCGLSAGADAGRFGGPTGPFSVFEAGVLTDAKGSRRFNCPAKGCQKENIRPYNQTLDACQHCGSTEVACKPGEGEQDLQEGQEELIAA
jgi:hypothetical protein